MKSILLILRSSLLVSGLFLTTFSFASTLRPTSLKCEYLDNPGAVDVITPRLSWVNQILDSKIHGEHQTSWQIQVATSSELLTDNKADVWDSQKQTGESSPFILYGGQELQPSSKYWWRVRVWDSKDNASQWSLPASWTTGLMGNWKALWIGAPWDEESPRDLINGKTLLELYPDAVTLSAIQKLAPSTPAPLFSKTFNISKPIRSARLFTTGLGYFETYLNGECFSDDLFVPNLTDYSSRVSLDKRRLPLRLNPTSFSVMYLGYDLTPFIRSGENVLEYILGNGFFNSVNVWVAGYGSPRMIAQLEIEYSDGTHETIISDQSWKVTESRIVSNDIYAGEIYDATKTESNWQNAVLRKAPDGNLTAQTGPSDKVMETLSPVSINKIGVNTFHVKFSKEVSGRIKLSNINGQEGDTIKLHFLDGSVSNYDYNGSVCYVIGNKPNQSYASHFCWFVFDGVVISNWPSDRLSKDDIQAEVIYSDVKTNATFKSSNPLIDSILSMWVLTQKNNMHGSLPSDCPHREKTPYTGDGQLSGAMVMHNFDARSFYLKWITDIMNTQDSKTGYVPNSAPWEPGAGGGPAWGAAMTLLPWEYYLAYGDKKLLQDCYEAMKAQTNYMSRWRTRTGTMFSRINRKEYYLNLGEHLPPFTSPDQEFIHTYMWMTCCETIAKAAKVLGNQKDVDLYEDIAGDILGAFMAKYYNYRIGSYGKDECDVIALHMRVIEEEKIVADLLRILDSHDGHILTGYVGTRIFFETLSDNGLDEAAYKALTVKGYPGYAYMIENGSTTMWEQWDGKNSHDHPALGSGLVWVYRYLTGVKIDPDQPAYRHFEISPYIPSDLHEACYSLETIYGQLKSAWSKNDKYFSMDIIVPEGCSCTLVWPVKNVRVKGKGLISTEEQGTYKLLSGQYHLYSKK